MPITDDSVQARMLNADAIAPGGVGGIGATDNKSFFEPQRTNNFHLFIPGISGESPSAGVDIMDFSLESFDFPKESNDPIDVPFGNETRRVAGKVNFSELALVLKDYVDQGTADMVREWRQQVYDAQSGAIGFASSYKKLCTLTLFAPNSFYERKFTLAGVWPMDVNYGQGDMNGNDYNRIEMTLSVDKVYPGIGIRPTPTLKATDDGNQSSKVAFAGYTGAQ